MVSINTIPKRYQYDIDIQRCQYNIDPAQLCGAMAKRAKYGWSQGGAVDCSSWWMVGGCGLLTLDMCSLAERELHHLLYVILYRDNYPTVTRGTGGVRPTCRDVWYSLGPLWVRLPIGSTHVNGLVGIFFSRM